MAEITPTKFVITGEMTIKEAGPIWLASRKAFVAATTYRDYGMYLRVLEQFFPGLLGRQITADGLRAYQEWRSEMPRRNDRGQVKRAVGPQIINKEITIVRQMLKRIGHWEEIRPEYESLPVPGSPGRALTEDEEYRLFAVGKLNPNWQAAYYSAVLSAHTAAGPGELVNLRLRDVFLGDGDPSLAWIRIHEHVKNKFRVRTIPLDREAFQAMNAVCERARSLGSVLPEHYIFPFRINPNTFDPTRHQTTFKTAWREMTAAADIPGRLRMYDLRHHCLTRLAERVPEQVLLKVAGHCSPAMLRKVYAHVREPAVRAAVEGLSRPDGWRPISTDRRWKPQPPLISAKTARMTSAEQRARMKQITEGQEEDDGWLRLAGETSSSD
jgi:integrase